MDPLRYRLEPFDPDGHRLRVTLTLPDPDPAGQVLTLPRWIPGSYLIREFARHWIALHAHADGRPVPLTALDGHCWRAAPCSGALVVEGEVHAHDRSVREIYLDRRLGFFNGTALFLRPEGCADRPCLLEVAAPPQRPWRLATTLAPEAVGVDGFGRYRARDYDELIDHPLLMGELTTLPFHAGGLEHRLDLVGLAPGRPLAGERLTRDLGRVCEAHQRLFGDPPPIDQYRFLAWATDNDYGGLEHRASCALMFPRDDLPTEAEAPADKGYRRFLGLCSHEYLHTWLVKRIRPAALAGADLGREAHTRDLWVFEGITSYYDDLALVRAGVVSPEDYLAAVGETLTRVLRSPGRRHQSIAESSFQAWIKLYRADAHAPNLMTSYYSKGALTALALDLTLRRASDGRHSLDDVLAALWTAHGVTGEPLPDGAFPAFAEAVTGVDLGEFTRRYVDGTEDPPLAELLAWVGVDLHLRRPESADDAGGTPGRLDDARLATRGWLGCQLARGEDRVQAVRAGSPAERAGLAPGDRLLAIAGEALDPARWWDQVARLGAGAEVTLAYRHDGLLQEARTTLAEPPRDTAWLALRADVDAATAARRRAWLGAGEGVVE